MDIEQAYAAFCNQLEIDKEYAKELISQYPIAVYVCGTNVALGLPTRFYYARTELTDFLDGNGFKVEKLDTEYVAYPIPKTK